MKFNHSQIVKRGDQLFYERAKKERPDVLTYHLHKEMDHWFQSLETFPVKKEDEAYLTAALFYQPISSDDQNIMLEKGLPIDPERMEVIYYGTDLLSLPPKQLQYARLKQVKEETEGELLPLDFMVWYSGMEKDKILKAFERYKKEKRK